MTDEEKQAIDDLFSLTHINGYINLYDQKKANIYTSDLKRWQNGVKVLLNLTNNQQSEIRQYEKALHDQIIKDYDIEIGLKEEIEKKDKIIDEMVICMEQAGTGRRGFSCIFRESKECNENGCRVCIKEYFKKKVEEK